MAEEELLAHGSGARWSLRVSLATRILAVNIIALALMAGSLFYIDSYRNELLAERFQLARAEAEIAATGLAGAPAQLVPEHLANIGTAQQVRLRLYDPDGEIVADSFDLAEPSYTFIDPETEPWYQDAARLIDRGMDFMLGSPTIPDYSDPERANAQNWPEIAETLENKKTVVMQRRAPDRTPVISAATPVGDGGAVLLVTRNARDITQNVRDARQTLVIIVGTALIVSILLSLFLARTIVQPLRRLMRATVRVRLGRDRTVVVPRLPDRRDEIGLLARAVSDMTAALRHRIDAVESFAADVSHEIKNPLTSLRSALESLGKVQEPELQRQLLAVANQDVARIDRLVTEIADASRIDAELSRTVFERVDMLALVRALVAERQSRGVNRSSKLVVLDGGHAEMWVAGDAARLERVLHNLIDNAVSFSPEGEPVEIALGRYADEVEITVFDHGPGIPPEAREKVFERFNSLRPETEEFGNHSGLGLAIARTIVEAHYGTLSAGPRDDGDEGAALTVTLPAWEDA